MRKVDGLDFDNLDALLTEDEKMVSETVRGWVEDNVVQRVGTSGMEIYYSDAIPVQNNEVYGTEQ